MSFKKFDGSTWQPITPKKLKGIPYTGTLPATLTGTKAGYLHRYKIYGNTEQTGTPTPENPIMPSECGELETAGVHTGQYKLSLTSAGQDVDIYLGESQLDAIGEYMDYVDYDKQKIIRKIAKMEFDGSENWHSYQNTVYTAIPNYVKSVWGMSADLSICSHYAPSISSAAPGKYSLGGLTTQPPSRWNGNLVINAGMTVTEYSAYLASQAAAGTPVTFWYVVEIPVEQDPPLPFPQIPTSAGSTTISWAGEGLAPSEFDSVREWVDIPTYTRVNGEWVADN